MEEQTTIERNKALACRFAEVLNSRQYDHLDELVAADVMRHCEATPGVTVPRLSQGTNRWS